MTVHILKLECSLGSGKYSKKLDSPGSRNDGGLPHHCHPSAAECQDWPTVLDGPGLLVR